MQGIYKDVRASDRPSSRTLPVPEMSDFVLAGRSAELTFLGLCWVPVGAAQEALHLTGPTTHG